MPKFTHLREARTLWRWMALASCLRLTVADPLCHPQKGHPKTCFPGGLLASISGGRDLSSFWERGGLSVSAR